MKKFTWTFLAFSVACALTALADGKEVYDKGCAKCHGASGKGDTKMGQKLEIKDYTTKKSWEKLTDEKALKSIKDGMKKDDKVLMKPSELSEADQKASLEYMKTLAK